MSLDKSGGSEVKKRGPNGGEENYGKNVFKGKVRKKEVKKQLD